MDKRKVTALMTAESIIVALLVAYGPTVNNTLVSLMKRGEPIFGTVLAVLLISGLAITAFRSIYLLYRSIDISDVDDVLHGDERYRAGRDLFLLVIVGSALYVMINAFSILHYAMTGANVPDIEPLYTIIAASFFGGWVSVVVFTPLELTDRVRKIRRKFGARLRGVAGLFVVGDMVLAAIEGYPQGRFLLEWPLCLLPAAFAVLTIVALWMLMIPESWYADLGFAGPVDED